MMYLLSIGRRGFTNSPCRFLSKLRIMCLTVVLPQKKGSSKRLFSSCQTWMRSLDCPTHIHGVEDVHHDILQVVVEVSDQCVDAGQSGQWTTHTKINFRFFPLYYVVLSSLTASQLSFCFVVECYGLDEDVVLVRTTSESRPHMEL